MFKYKLRNLSMVAIDFQGMPPLGGRAGFPLLCGFAFLSNGGVMVPLAWDPDRYDIISEHRLFLCTWTIWDHCEFAEVRLFAFLAISDLQSFCSVSYCIYVDSEDILARRNEFRRLEG